jgi:hypothetical protein
VLMMMTMTTMMRVRREMGMMTMLGITISE